MRSPWYSSASQADGGRLDPHRQVLGDQGDVVALVGEVAGDREDPGVVVAEPEAGRQRVGVGVVELDPDRAALVADRHRLVEPPVRDPQLVEHAQRRAREVAELRVVALPSSSVITTTGRTTSCSANRRSAPGSASSTLVSRTKVRTERFWRTWPGLRSPAWPAAPDHPSPDRARTPRPVLYALA